MASHPPGETIGKYRVLARIGRGGMGTVLKAHDPILDRVVALKVISADVDVTDELRARFFREAQAGARLSHPNIVTVYDLAEADGRRVIVMEFLDGVELRQVIAERRPLGLDEKLGIMIQLCDGLAYAHRHGVVHRDIKPGNIFLLRNGNAKILDFGVARIVAADAGLTRTGLIMGTLRYIAPEQARGRADHRSDIFSAGAVCYELLAYRSAFPGDDPMEILEAIRSHEPPALNEIDASIPAELAAVVARAMQKDPERRVQDLAQMSEELQSIRRGLLATLDGARQRLRSRLDDVAKLQAAIGNQLGGAVDEETVPIPHEGGLATLAALEQNAEERIARLNALLAASARLQPTLERGLQSLAVGHLDDAITALERVVHDIPEHARARAALEEARSRAEGERRRALEEAAQRTRQSRRAMELARAAAEAAEAPALAVDAWQAAASRSSGGDAAAARHDDAVAAEIFDAATALFQQAASEAEERRRQRARATAEAAAHDVTRTRELAVSSDAERYAPAAWQTAVEKEALASEALARGDFAVASTRFGEARHEYERSAEAAQAERTRQERDAARRARVDAEAGRETAQLADAATHASEAWTRAEQLRIDGEALLARGANTAAASRFAEATSFYTSAAEQARAAVQLRRQRTAETARARLEQRKKRAEEAGAPRETATVWAAAENATASGRAAAERGDFLEAAAAFERASEAFADAEAAAREATLRRAALAEEAAEAERRARVDVTQPTSDVDATALRAHVVAEAARPAEPVVATPPPPSPVHDAPSSRPVRSGVMSGLGRAVRARPRTAAVAAIAVGVIAVGVAGRSLLSDRERPPQSTSTGVPSRAPARESLSELRQRVADARNTAEMAGAERLAPSAFRSAMSAESQGVAALSASDLGQAEQHLSRALADFTAAGKAAAETQEAEIATLRSQVAEARQAAEKAGVAGPGLALMKTAREREAQGEVEAGRARFAEAAVAFRDAEANYRRALETTSSVLAQDDQENRLSQVRAGATAARDAATKSGAASVAEEVFEAANRRWSSAQSEATSRNVGAAIQSFGDAERRYRDAERLARKRQALRQDAESGRDRAKTAGADFLAKDIFDGGSARLAEGHRMVSARDWAAAERAYADAVGLWADAQRRLSDLDKVRVEAEKAKERREQARLAGAEGLAKEYFDAAAARHVEADRLARSADVTAAIPVYQEAARRYADAEKRVRDSKKN
jgi:hypothetical protein